MSDISVPRVKASRNTGRKIVASGLVFLLACSGAAHADDNLRVAAQKTGTFSWELGVIKEHGLDKKAGIHLDVTELATTEAGKVAIMGGSADIAISDWLWVSRERSLGGKLKFYPYSSTLGAVMVPPASSIAKLADLKGKKLGVAGGPLDKSWLLLQAYAKNSGIDLEFRRGFFTPRRRSSKKRACKARTMQR